MNLEEYDFDRLLGLGYTEKATGGLKDACWKGYTAVGTKKKGGREVPNCVPVEKSKSEHSEMTGEELTQGRITPTKSRRPFIFGPSAGSPSFAESVEEVLDFARCQRPDGTYYGTSGTCRKGTQVKDLEERIKRQERFLRTADPSKYSPKEIAVEKKELQRLKSQLAGMKSTKTAGGKVGGAKVGSEKRLRELSVEDLKKLREDPRLYKYQKDRLDAIISEKSGGLKRDPSKDVKRGGTLIGTSPRNKSIDDINEYKARLKDARSPEETALLKATIKSMEAKLEGGEKASPADIAREESKLATLEKRLAAAEDKASRTASGGSGVARGGGRLMTASGRRRVSAADRAITKEQELSKQVREQRAKVNEMKGIKPKVEKPAPRTAKDDRRDKLRETIDSINSRAKRLAEGKGRDSEEYKRFVRKYGDTLTKLIDEQRKLMIEV